MINNIKNDLYSKEYYSSNKATPIDFDNLELMFLYVGNYKQFKNFQLNLNAKYIFEYSDNTLVIKDNKSYLNIYPNNVNLKILCGENGSGKSTIIQILKSIEDCHNCFVVYKTRNGHFVTNNNNLTILYKNKSYYFDDTKYDSRTGKYFHLEDDYELVNIVDSNYQARFCHGYLFHYTDLNKALNKKYKNYFDSFSIGFDDLKRNADDLESTIEIRYNIPINEIEGLSLYLKHNPIKFIMLNEAFDSSFDSLHEKFKTKILPDDNKNINKLFDKLLEKIYGIQGFNTISKINEEFINLIYDTSEYTYSSNNKKCPNINNIENTLFSFDYENLKYHKLKEYQSYNYEKYLKIIKNFEKRLNKIYHTPLNKNVNLNILQYFYFNLFKKTENGNIYFYKLSKGEQQQFVMILNLYYKLVQANSLAQTLIFEDDIDANLHPEWSRRYIYTYMKALKIFSKNKNKIRNIIFTTHSPFVLSDTTNDYIEYLKIKNVRKNGKIYSYTKLRNKKKIKKSFASNIMQMFEDNMFMKASIGEYSRNILKEVLNYKNEKKITQPILLRKNLSKKEKDKISSKIINSIGDEVLRMILNNKYEKDNNGKTGYCEY